ncbi:MAG: hypothetical protein AAF612_01110 [Planctomycetota bacterium]
MKLDFLRITACFAACGALVPAAWAQPTAIGPSGVVLEFDPVIPAGDTIQGFGVAQDGAVLFSYGSFAFPNQSIGFDEFDSGVQTNLFAGAPGADFPGTATVHASSAGEFGYFLQDNFPTPGFGRVSTAGGAATIQNTVSPVSSFTGFGDRMFVAGFDSDSSLFVGDINAVDGSVGALTEITDGALSGSSGPIAFNAAGDLYFAPGFGDLTIYRWSAAEVAAAIADPVNNGLTEAGSVWADYSGNPLLNNLSGATGLAVTDDGDVVATLTSFVDPSLLVFFDADASGGFVNTQRLATSAGRLGSVRVDPLSDDLLFNDPDAVYRLAVVPEPATGVLLGGAVLLCRRRRGIRGFRGIRGCGG